MIEQIIFGADKVKEVGIELLSLFVNTIASSTKREEIIYEIKNKFFFEKTKAYKKQIIYL